MKNFARLRDLGVYSSEPKGFAVNGVLDIYKDLHVTEPLWMFGILRPAKDVEIQIDGPLIAGAGRIFDLSRGGIITGTPEVEYVYPSWWGADRDARIDSSTPINQAIAFCNGSYKPAVHHVPGRYRCLSPIVKAQSFQCPIISGVGGGGTSDDNPGGTVWDFSEAQLTDGQACVILKGGSGQLVHGGIKDIRVVGNGQCIGLQFNDQGGAYANNVHIDNCLDGIELYNEAGFSEWTKLLGCQVSSVGRYAFRLRRGAGTESFHGVEILDCWTNLSPSSPAAVYVGAGCRWYNGTARLRVFFAKGLTAPQYAIASEPAGGGTRENYAIEADGYIKGEGGGGFGMMGDYVNPIHFPGPVLAAGGVRYGGLRPVYFSMGLGPEGGFANGRTAALSHPFSFGPRPITVNSEGRWNTGVSCGNGNVACEIVVAASDYEYRVSGIAKAHGYGGAGRWVSLDSWPLNNARGFGPPEFEVTSDHRLNLINARYPPGEVRFYVWLRELTLSTQSFGRFATMED